MFEKEPGKDLALLFIRRAIMTISAAWKSLGKNRRSISQTFDYNLGISESLVIGS